MYSAHLIVLDFISLITLKFLTKSGNYEAFHYFQPTVTSPF